MTETGENSRRFTPRAFQIEYWRTTVRLVRRGNMQALRRFRDIDLASGSAADNGVK
jgi:hypothetical protein